MRAVALVSLATGAVVDMEFAKYAGKGTGEIALFRKVSEKLRRDSIVVADRYYPSFATMALLKARGIDLVSISHQSRKIDFSAGHVLGPQDHIVAWQKPRGCYAGVSQEIYADLPDGQLVREFVIDIEGRNGGKEQAVVVTTLTDPTIAQKEISDLYWARWNCEVDIRAIKHSFNLETIRAKSPSMVRKEIWGHLLAYNLLRGTMVESAKRHDMLPRHLSVKGTMQAIESFTPAMMAIDGSDTLYNAMLTTVSAHRVGNRSGRQEPRAQKAPPLLGSLHDDSAQQITPAIGRGGSKISSAKLVPFGPGACSHPGGIGRRLLSSSTTAATGGQTWVSLLVWGTPERRQVKRIAGG